MEQEIVEAVASNDILVICGQTGSGKSTQLPQFLYEAGYCKNNNLIGITQPVEIS
jgi:ATP-dependent RNA helicase DHX8/PRP22